MDLRLIRASIGRLFRRGGLSLARRTMAQAVRKISPPHAILIVGPPAAGKTTLFRYLRHEPLPNEPARTVARPRTGRIAADLAGTETSFFLSQATDEVIGARTNHGEGLIRKYNPDGIILIIDPDNPAENYPYFHALYTMYREFSTHTKKVNLRVLLILLNKFDRWGSTVEARDAMMHRYRDEVFQELVNQFRSSFGITVQFGYASLTQPEHAPYNDVILQEFLVAVEQGE